jgi:hypothetical protein
LFDMPASPEHEPSDFAEILGAPELPLIVGGQAVNTWAYFYLPAIPDLEEYAPFTSKDADIYGTRALARDLANRAGWECQFEEKRAPIVVAVLRKRSTLEGEAPLAVEVLGEVNGLTAADLALDTIIDFEGESYRIPAPPILLKAKLYNLASLVFSERPQDLKHVRMLCEIVPHYLNELHAEFRAGRLAEKLFAAAVCYTADVITSGYAGNAANPRGLNLARVIPASVWLSGLPSLEPTIERLKNHGFAP